MFSPFFFLPKSILTSKTSWTCSYAMGSSTNDSSSVKKYLISALAVNHLLLRRPHCPYICCWNRGKDMESGARARVYRRKTPQGRTLTRRDAWIVWAADIFGSSVLGWRGRREVFPVRGADPLRPLHAGESERVSCHPSRLQTSAQGARLRLLYGLRSGERSVLWSSHGQLRWRSPLFSQAWWGQTSLRSHQGTGGLHWKSGPRYSNLFHSSLIQYLCATVVSVKTGNLRHEVQRLLHHMENNKSQILFF